MLCQRVESDLTPQTSRTRMFQTCQPWPSSHPALCTTSPHEPEIKTINSFKFHFGCTLSIDTYKMENVHVKSTQLHDEERV